MSAEDRILPGLPGVAVLLVDDNQNMRRLRTDRNSPAPDVPVVMLTGHTDQSIVMRARDAGIDDFVVKPVSAKQLAERPIRLVGRKADATAA